MKLFSNIIKVVFILLFLQSCSNKIINSMDSQTGIFSNKSENYTIKISNGFSLTKKIVKPDIINKLYPDKPENIFYFYNDSKDILLAFFNSGIINLEPKVRKPIFLHYYEQDFLNLSQKHSDIKVLKVERAKNDLQAEIEIQNELCIIKIQLIPESELSEKHNSFVFIVCTKKENRLEAREELIKMSESLKEQ